MAARADRQADLPARAGGGRHARRVAAIGAGVVVEPGDDGAIRSAVDPAALRAAITTVLTNDRFTRAARSVAADVRRLPPVDDAVTVLHAMT